MTEWEPDFDRPVKLVFADIDGVLNGIEFAMGLWHNDPRENYPVPERVDDPAYAAACIRRRARLLNPKCVHFLDELLTETDARLVITSNWRGIQPPGVSLSAILATRGLSHPIFGETPDRSSEKRLVGLRVVPTRWDEIRDFLTTCERPVASFVILDDDPIDDAPKHRFVQTNRDTGLQPMDICRAREILKNVENDLRCV